VVGILAIVGLPMLLIMQQPDLGTALVFLPVAFGMMFAAGVPGKTMGTLSLIGLCGVGLVLGAVFLPEKAGLDEETQQRAMRMVGLSTYHKKRIEVFFHADADPLGAGWNKRQSEIAVGSGGAWGKGFRKGTQNILGFLPRSVAPTDFIYSVIAEEAGFFGSGVVLFLFAVVIGSGLRTAFVARDKMGRLLCVGIVTLVFAHTFVNVGMTVGLMPITGLPLPLLSYGGSFMLVMMSALGVMQSVRIRSRRTPIIYEQGRLWKTAPGSL
jgi:rod shape determining protein RodA